MIIERSYGIIPFCKEGDEKQVLLVQHGKSKYWGFPKGHSEGEETAKEAAIRELKEETNLHVIRFFSDIPFEGHYYFSLHGEMISKHVEYFPAEVSGEVSLQLSEIADGRWFSVEEALSVITYDLDRKIFDLALALV